MKWERDEDLLYVLKNGVNLYEVKVTLAAGSRKITDRAECAKILLEVLAKTDTSASPLQTQSSQP